MPYLDDLPATLVGRRFAIPHYWQPGAYPYTEEFYPDLIALTGTAMLDEQYASTAYLDEMVALGVAAGTFVRYGVRCAPWGTANINPQVTTGDAAEIAYRTGRIQAVKTALAAEDLTLSLIYADVELWPGVRAATLSTRGSNTTGSLTLSAGATACVASGQTITLTWTGGTRTTVIGLISDPKWTISGGSGDALPVQGTSITVSFSAAWYTARAAKLQAFVDICTSEFPGVPVLFYGQSGRFAQINTSNEPNGLYSFPNYVAINDPGNFSNVVFNSPSHLNACVGSMQQIGLESPATAEKLKSVWVWQGSHYKYSGGQFTNIDEDWGEQAAIRLGEYVNRVLKPSLVLFYPGPNLGEVSSPNAHWWTTLINYARGGLSGQTIVAATGRRQVPRRRRPNGRR